MPAKSAALTFVIQLLCVGMAIAACVITGTKLWYSTTTYVTTFYYPYGYPISSTHLCLLSPLKSENMCAYAWASAAIGMVAAIILAATACTVAGACMVATSLFSWVWWLAAAITLTIYGKDADDDELTVGSQTINYAWPQEGYRTSIWAMAWAQFGLCTLQTLIAVAAMRGAKAPPEGELHYGKAPEGAYKASDAPVAPPPAYV